MVYPVFFFQSKMLDRFRFSCTNFDDNLKGQIFKTSLSGCVCSEYRAILNISESLNQKEPGIKKIWYPYFAFDMSRVVLCPYINKNSLPLP